MPRVSVQQLAEKCDFAPDPDYKSLARAIAELMGMFVYLYPKKDLGHVIAVELGYGKWRS